MGGGMHTEGGDELQLEGSQCTCARCYHATMGEAPSHTSALADEQRKVGDVVRDLVHEHGDGRCAATANAPEAADYLSSESWSMDARGLP